MIHAFSKKIYKAWISLEMIKNKKSCDIHYHFCFDSYSTWLIFGLCVNYILTTDHGLDQSVVILNTACVLSDREVGWKTGVIKKKTSNRTVLRAEKRLRQTKVQFFWTW